jgi:propanol-preferring alcohol dehydrogenase
MQARCYPEMLRMVESGKITPSSLVTEEVSMEETGRVLQDMSDYNTLGYSVITNP